MAQSKTAIKRSEMFINGTFVPNASRKMIPVVNPATEELISEIPAGTPEDAALAVASAEKAQKSWGKLPAIKRAAYLREIAAAIRQKKDLLARTIVEEQGKICRWPKWRSSFTADYFDYMAEFARRYRRRNYPKRPPQRKHFAVQDADWRDRRHSAMELSFLPDRAQDGSGTGDRQHDRHQAKQ